MTKPEDKPSGRQKTQGRRTTEVVYAANVRRLPEALATPKGPVSQLKVYKGNRAELKRGTTLLWSGGFTKFETPTEDGQTVIKFWMGDRQLITLHRVDRRRKPKGKP